MRRVLEVLAGVALVAALVFAWWSSRDAPAPSATGSHGAGAAHRAPFEAFAQAQVGDWYAVRRTNPGDIAVTVVFRVRAVDGDRVTRAMRGRVDSTGEVHDEPDDVFPRSGLTLETLTGLGRADWKLGEVVVTDETRVVAGRTFACKKVTFHPADPLFPNKQTTTELWLSSEVPAGGLVAEHEVQRLGEVHFESTEEITGFGSAAGASWGTLPEGL
jgi:hypothetical protein